MEKNELSENARGGTEIMLEGLHSRLDPGLVAKFQIIPSRVRELDPGRIRVLYLHDLPHDPESQAALADGGWRKFHRIVCVSNWQMQRYAEAYGIPYGRLVVMHNAIEPFAVHDKPSGPVRLVYTSTPQRGLDVLVEVFGALAAEDPDVELEVFSSFKLYGWPEADAKFEPLFERLRALPRATYHGTQPNAVVREALARSHVFAYPSTWPETSCICLIEAMSAGLVCVHPNYGALFETGGGFTAMYQWDDDKAAHAARFLSMLRAAVASARSGARPPSQGYANFMYSWDRRVPEWDALLRGLVDLPLELDDGPVFHYRT